MTNAPSDFLTREPVEGELLADRLARGPLPAREALRCAIEIGGILSQSHRRGEIHGALSPHSIAITAQGARILQPPSAIDERSDAYRAPEQVRGEAADWRSDIFSYGAVLYEMALGRPAFPGRGDEAARRILEDPPAPPAEGSPAYALMEPVIASCLQKQPIGRRQRIQNAVSELKLRARQLEPSAPAAPPATTPAAVTAPARSRFRSRALLWIFGAALVLIAVAAAVLLLILRPAPASFAFQVELPQGVARPSAPAISPDGRYLAFSAVAPGGRSMLWLRRLDSLAASAIPGTEGAALPFWSPDGARIGFFADRSLKIVPFAGGAPEIICAADLAAGGAAWGADDGIVFAPGLSGGLYRVAAKPKAAPEPVVSPDPQMGEAGFRWPQFLPGRQHFIFFVQTGSSKTTGVYVGTPASREYRQLIPSDTNAIYALPSQAGSRNTGQLLFMLGRDLMAQAFDADRLAPEGDPAVLLDGIGAMAGIALAPVSVSNNGMLAYESIAPATRQMIWTDSQGSPLSTIAQPGKWGDPRISPDGSRALAAMLGPDGENADLWVLDRDGNATRLTDTPYHEGSPVWSPDGKRAAYFESGPGVGNFDLYTKPVVAAAAPQLLLRTEFPKYPTDWSRDRRYLLFTTVNPGTKADVWALCLPNGSAGPVLATISNEGYAVLSPDGKWLAFQSDESGKNEVYVERFDGIDSSVRRHYRVSSGGGGHPRWRGDGAQLFYITQDGRVMAAPVRTSGDEIELKPAVMLFHTYPLPKEWNLYDVSPDGRRFLLDVPLEIAAPASITVVTNWSATRRAPVRNSE